MSDEQRDAQPIDENDQPRNPMRTLPPRIRRLNSLRTLPLTFSRPNSRR